MPAKFPRKSLTLLLAFVALLSPEPCHPQQEDSLDPDIIIDALRADDNPRNACFAITKIQHGLYGWSMPPLVAPLEGCLVDPDYQLRQLATVLLCRHFMRVGRSLSSWPDEMFENMVEGLGDDDLNTVRLYPNARWYVDALMDSPAKVPDEAISILEEALDDGDYQRSQFAAGILSAVYRNRHIPCSDWPESYFRSLLAGLRDDWMYGGWTFQNHRHSLVVLYKLKERRPVDEVRALLRENDRQAQFGAAVILSRYLCDSVQPEVSRVLASHLPNDEIALNEVAVTYAFYFLGKENLEEFLKGFEPSDPQDAAIIQCLCALLGVHWYAEDVFLPQWYDECVRRGDRKAHVESAALYVHPRGAEFLKGKEAIPRMARLRRRWKEADTFEDRGLTVGVYFWRLPSPGLRCDRDGPMDDGAAYNAIGNICPGPWDSRMWKTARAIPPGPPRTPRGE